MYLNFDDNRPDTPRVPQALTRLERVLIAVVAYQALTLSYVLAPNSFWAQPVQELLSQEPLRYVSIEPLVDRTAIPKKVAPPSDLDRRAATPEPVPKAQNTDPLSRGNTPERIQGGPQSPPQMSEAPRPATGLSPSDAPPLPPRVPGGILGNAMRNLQRYVDQNNMDNAEGGGAEQGSDVQFDSKGVDFGPWLRRFRAQVYRNWMIPQAAMVMKGHVSIRMAVHRNGTISGIQIIGPSGIESFDTAAVTALKMSNPTMRLPENYPGDVIDPFTVTFYYNERIK